MQRRIALLGLATLLAGCSRPQLASGICPRYPAMTAGAKAELAGFCQQPQTGAWTEGCRALGAWLEQVAVLRWQLEACN